MKFTALLLSLTAIFGGNLTFASALAKAAPSIAGCPIFPAHNVWNTAIDYDAAGNVSDLSNEASATTSALPDTQPPTVPTGLTATVISSTQIDLSWTASTDDVGVAGYIIYRNGTQIGTAAGTSYQSTGLKPNTSYTYRVKAYDEADNRSAKSVAVTKTTQPVPSTKFKIGDRVKTIEKAKVRSEPTGSGTVSETQPKAAQGVVMGGPWYWNQRWWWEVDFDSGLDGWVAQRKLKKVQSLQILDSYERLEYASASDFKTSASVKLSTGEPVGYVIKLANDSEMPTCTFTRLYKMVPIDITTPSYSGGKTGAFYDALVPLLESNLPGTQYVYAEYEAPAWPGSETVMLSQSGETVTLNVRVINNTLTPNPVPLHVAVINSFMTAGHYGKYVNGSEALGIPYLREAVAHRITPYSSYVFAPPLKGGLLDYEAGGNWSFRKNVLDFVPQGFMLPNYTDPTSLQAAEATVKAKGQSAWFYTRDEPGPSDVASTNARIALQKQYAPSIKTMVTTSATSGITPDIYCPVIDHFAVQTWPGGPIMPGEEAYTGKELWLYTSCMEHGCGADRSGNVNAPKVSGSSTGAPGFSLDRPAAYIYAFIAMPLRYKSLKGLLYYNSVEQYKLYGQGVDVWTDQFNFGGNGDGTLFYPLRAGMYGSEVEQPAVSIRLKKIRDAQYLMDYAAQAGSDIAQECGAGALITDSLHWQKDASAYRQFRDCLIERLGF